ncbi:MAG: hypothetical protein ACXWOH_13555, partial [Bdellovibrionota bacterium]
MAGSWRAKIAPWIPARIGRLPYRAALAALRGFARGGVFGPGVQIWARNSYELGTLVPLVSDLDLKIWFERDPGPKGWARAREAFGALKRA